MGAKKTTARWADVKPLRDRVYAAALVAGKAEAPGSVMVDYYADGAVDYLLCKRASLPGSSSAAHYNTPKQARAAILRAARFELRRARDEGAIPEGVEVRL